MIQTDNELKNSFTPILPNTINALPDDVYCVQFKVPSTLSYYVGHFPSQPILPAVAFIDISTIFISQAAKALNLNLPENYLEIPLLKIEKIVSPSTTVCKLLFFPKVVLLIKSTSFFLMASFF